MLIANEKPLCLIGYKNSTITQEANYFIGAEFSGQIIIIEPENFLNLVDKNSYQYIIAFTLDQQLRKHVIEVVDSMNLDCIRYVHNSVVCNNLDMSDVIGRGSFISPFSSLLIGTKIGNHCIVETYCLLSHYSTLGNNVHLHAGAMIAGRTQVGNNSIFNFRSSVLNALTLCDGIELGATSTITKNIEQPGKYVGTPARYVGPIKEFNNV